jgi:GPH family glycoside/pentoside/hexuronide:cation symporter
LLTKVIYGSGDWGMASFNTIRQFFYAIFLTDVVGLEPRLASIAALIGVLWDAINDPLVGAWSDRIRSRWGRRRPFLLFFTIPYGLAFMLLWWAPPWQNQIVLTVHMALAYMLSDTFQTLVVVPFLSLTPDITGDYDERTSLTAYRMLFNLIASLLTGAIAPILVDAALARGGTLQQGYMLVAAIFGFTSIIPFLAIFFVVRERPSVDRSPDPVAFFATLRTSWQNVPFRYASVLYMLNWAAFDLLSIMLPYFLTYWVSGGDLLAKAPFLGLPLESAVLGFVFIVALAMLPLWTWAARRFGKRKAYMVAMALGAVLLLAMLTVQPNQIAFGLGISVLVGISVSAAHVLPDAIFPDVIDWDELFTGTRHEGIYYGTKNFLRKLTGAFSIFLALQVLGWLGYQAPPEGATLMVQPAAALWGIRILTAVVTSGILIGAAVAAWRYPLDRQRYNRVRRLLERRQRRKSVSVVGEGA